MANSMFWTFLMQVSHTLPFSCFLGFLGAALILLDYTLTSSEYSFVQYFAHCLFHYPFFLTNIIVVGYLQTYTHYPSIFTIFVSLLLFATDVAFSEFRSRKLVNRYLAYFRERGYNI